MKTTFSILALSLLLAACGNQAEQTADDKIAENAKQIELLKQEAEIKRLQAELDNLSPASAAAEVFQLAASEVANVIPEAAQAAAKAGEVVQGADGQQYTFDPDTGSWLLYGAIGAGLGYLAANAMNNRHKYQPVQKPTAAVQRVYKDYKTKDLSTLKARQVTAAQSKPAAQQGSKYRPTNQGYSNTQQPKRRFGRRR